MQIYIFCKNAENEIIQTQIDTIYKHFDITIVTPKTPLDKYKNVKYINDSEILSDNNVNKLTKFQNPGWVKQQLLKTKVLESDHHDKIILDGDTIFTNKALTKIAKKKIQYHTRESPEIYGPAMQSALGIKYQSRSFVANCGAYFPNQIVYGQSIHELLLKWIEVEGNRRSPKVSEYTLLGNLNYQHGIKDEKLKIFRRGDLIYKRAKTIAPQETPYDAICFEAFHKSSLTKRIIANILFRAGIDAW